MIEEPIIINKKHLINFEFKIIFNHLIFYYLHFVIFTCCQIGTTWDDEQCKHLE